MKFPVGRGQVKALLLKGLLWSVPALFTIWLATVLFGIADSIMGFITRALLYWFVPEFLHVGPFSGGESPMLSFVLLLGVLTVVGAFVSWRYGEIVVRFFDRLLMKMPGLGVVYRSARRIAEFFDGSKATPFERVVLVPYPHRDVYTIAFVAGKATLVLPDGTRETHLKVVVPNPPTGIQGIIMVPERLVLEVDMTVPQGLEYYLSVGMVSPPELVLKAGKSALPASEPKTP